MLTRIENVSAASSSAYGNAEDIRATARPMSSTCGRSSAAPPLTIPKGAASTAPTTIASASPCTPGNDRPACRDIRM